MYAELEFSLTFEMPCPPMKSNLSFFLVTRFASCSASLVASCFIFAAASSRAQSTVANMSPSDLHDLIYQVFFAGLYDFNVFIESMLWDSQGTPYYITEAIDSQGVNLSYYLGPQGSPDHPYLGSILARLDNWLGTTNISAQLGFEGDSSLQDALDDLSTDVSNIRTVVSNMTFVSHGHGNQLLVFDPMIYDRFVALSESLGDLLISIDQGIYLGFGEIGDQFYESLSGDNSPLVAIRDLLVDIKDQLDDDIDYWDEDVTVEEEDAKAEANREYIDEEEEAASEFNGISLPYVPEGDPDLDPGSDVAVSEENLGLADVEDENDHRALVQLVGRGSSYGVPEIEIDFGSMHSLTSGMERFSEWTEWLYGILFSVLLSVKGLSMWRVVRMATVASSVGEEPTIHLAWNPL